MQTTKSPEESVFESIEAGEQVLVDLGNHRDLLGHLPDRAFENLLLVSVGRHPRAVERTLTDLDRESKGVGVVPVLGSELAYDGPLWTSKRVSPGDLTGLSIEFSRGFEHVRDGGWVVFDNLSVLLMYTSSEQLYRFLSSVSTALQRRNAVGIFALSREAVDSQVFAQYGTLSNRQVSID